MARGDELMARIDASLAAIQEELRLSREQGARSDARYEEIVRRYEDQAQLTREVVRRNEVTFEDSHRVLAELVEEVRAQTRAILRVLDRLDGGAQPETT